MKSKPRNFEELKSWFSNNPGESFIFTRSVMKKVGDGQPFREVFISPITRYAEMVPSSSGVRFYLAEGNSLITWFSFVGLTNEQFHFTDEYFAHFTIEQNESVTQVTTIKYEYDTSLRGRKSVRRVLHCSVGDLNYDAGLRELSKEELKFCLANEPRKTGKEKIKRQARKHGYAVVGDDIL